MAPIQMPARVTTGSGGSSVDQPYGLNDIGHQGLMHDEHVGTYDNRGRILSTYGFYLQSDPTGYPDGMNNRVNYAAMLGRLDPYGYQTTTTPVTAKNYFLTKLSEADTEWGQSEVAKVFKLNVMLTRHLVNARALSSSNYHFTTGNGQSRWTKTGHLYIGPNADASTAVHEAIHMVDTNWQVGVDQDEAIATLVANNALPRTSVFHTIEDKLMDHSTPLDWVELSPIWKKAWRSFNAITSTGKNGYFSQDWKGKNIQKYFQNSDWTLAEQWTKTKFSCDALASHYNQMAKNHPMNCVVFSCQSGGDVFIPKTGLELRLGSTVLISELK